MMVGGTHGRFRRVVPHGVPVRPGGWPTRRAGVAVVAFYVAVAGWFWSPLLARGIGSVVHRSGDAYLNLSLFAWVPHALKTGQNPLFSTALNYPHGLNLLVNTGEPVLAAALWPIEAVFGPAAAYNVAVVLAMPLSALAAYLLARHLVSWRPAAAFCGLIVGFGPYEVQTSLGSHLQLSFTAVVPLLVLVGLWIARRQVSPLVGGLELAALGVVQFFISTEVLLTTTIVLGLTAFAALVCSAPARSAVRCIVGASVVAGVVGGIVLAWPVWFTLRGPGSIRGPVQLVAQAYRSDLLALIIPPRSLALAPASLTAISSQFSPGNTENVAYLGIPLVVAALASLVWSWRRPAVVVTALIAVATFVLGLGGSLTFKSAPAIGANDTAIGHLWLPEALLGQLPTVRNLIPSRFALYTAIFAALLVALGLDRLRREIKGVDARVVVPIGVMSLCLAPLVPLGAREFHLTPVGPAPSYLTSGAVPTGSALAIAPFPAGRRPTAMLWQIDAGFRFAMASGHAKAPFGPQHAVAFAPDLGYAVPSATASTLTLVTLGKHVDGIKARAGAVRHELAAWHIDQVVLVVAKVARPAQGVAALNRVLGEVGQSQRGVVVWPRPAGGW